jgi:hypothetical protein
VDKSTKKKANTQAMCKIFKEKSSFLAQVQKNHYLCAQIGFLCQLLNSRTAVLLRLKPLKLLELFKLTT